MSLNMKLPGQLDSRFIHVGRQFANQSARKSSATIYQISFSKPGFVPRAQTIIWARGLGLTMWLLKASSID